MVSSFLNSDGPKVICVRNGENHRKFMSIMKQKTITIPVQSQDLHQKFDSVGADILLQGDMGWGSVT